MKISSRVKDLTGSVFGRLSVVEYAGLNDRGKTTWLCRCSCGKSSVVVGSSLKNGDTTSCGCYRNEQIISRFELHRANMTGKTFGRLRVESVDHINNKITYYRCRCVCGNTTIVPNNNLSSNHTTSCGCYRHDVLIDRNDTHKQNMIGKTFGRLLVESVAGEHNGSTTYLCKCSCGNKKTVIGANLTIGNTTSCGCYNREINSILNTTHGHSDHRLYQIWNGMKQRCYNDNTTSYSNYGGRPEGKVISVCQEWMHNFQAFYSWAMDNGYRDNLTVERINNNGNYEPSNCKWATMSEQNQNKRNIKLTPEKAENIRNDHRKQVEIAEEYGISQSAVSGVKLNKTWKNNE